MLFNSFAFFLFFIVTTGIYFLVPHRFRWAILLIASCYFYLYFIPVYILILFATIVIDYFSGLYIEKSSSHRKKKMLLVLSILSNFGILFFFKYFNFLNENLGILFHGIGYHNPIPYLNIILPIGLSFHTFQAVSYIVEVYRGNQKAEKHAGIYALYVMFYPQLVAGPIERPQHMLHQFRELHTFEPKRVIGGIQLMLWGLFKKAVVSDLLSVYVNSIYSNYHSNTGLTFCVSTWAFAFMIYCDFSGYSDIAVGSAQVMGFTLMRNFNLPYFSKSVTEFWRRWHISLSSWLRDYLYIPLGGSRFGKLLTYRNLMITMLLGGLWHGASWNFIIWGGLNGLYLSLEKFLGLTERNRISETGFITRSIRAFLTFNLICITWIFFRSQNFDQAWYILSNIFHSPNFFTLRIQDTGIFASMLFTLSVMLLIEFLILRKKDIFYQSPENLSILRSGSLSAFLILMLVLFGYSEGGQFIYFQF